LAEPIEANWEPLRETRFSLCDLPHGHLSIGAGKVGLSSIHNKQRSFAMSGAHRLSLELDREPSFPSLRWASELNFGVITLALLATLAVVVTLMFPEIQLQPVDLFVGP
jgi:hypothetical protein